MVNTGRNFNRVVSPSHLKLTKVYYLARVMCILWNDMPHAPLGILYITLITRDDMDMNMEDTLPGRRPHVNADIVAIRVKFLVDSLFFIFNQVHTGRYLVLCQLEKASHMAIRDDQGMARAHPVGITGTVGKSTFQGHPLWIFTKQAGVIRVSLFYWFFFRRQASIPFI
jgi:hypothetical protein